MESWIKSKFEPNTTVWLSNAKMITTKKSNRWTKAEWIKRKKIWKKKMIKESEVKKDMAATGDVVRKIHFHVQPPFSFLDLLLFIYFFFCRYYLIVVLKTFALLWCLLSCRLVPATRTNFHRSIEADVCPLPTLPPPANCWPRGSAHVIFVDLPAKMCPLSLSLSLSLSA